MNKEIKSLYEDLKILARIKEGATQEIRDWCLQKEIRTLVKLDRIREAENMRQREEFFRTLDK